MDFKKIWRNMVETGLPVGILTFFKQALVSIKKLEKLFIAPKARLRLHETV